MKRFYAFLFLIVPVIMFSCQKEISLETGSLPGDSTIVTPGGNTCDLTKIVEADSATGIADYAYISSYNTAHKVVNIDIVDSATSTIDGSFAITYPAGRVQLDANQYFLVATDGKITEFHGYEYPEYSQGEKFVVKYTYNATGQLTLRTETYDTLPNVVQFQMKFTYANGNLATEQIEANLGATFLKLADVVYTYDASRTIKNSLYLYGLAPEISAFQTAISAGTRSLNPVSKTVITYVNPSTGASSVSTSSFLNYVIDTKGYVQSFTVSGADFSIAGLYAKKKYKMAYSCY